MKGTNIVDLALKKAGNYDDIMIFSMDFIRETYKLNYN